MKLAAILKEDAYAFYKVLVRITFDESLTTMDVAEMLRAIESVTIVTNAGTGENRNIAMYTVKIRTNLAPSDAYKMVKREFLAKQGIKKFEIANKTLEKLAK